MAETVEFLDTTLRDGNKLPFVVLDRHDRLVIARQLAALGVDIIDAGYPAASEEERDIVAAIAEEVRGGPRISALSRAVVEDVAAVCQLLGKSKKPHVHIFLPLSPHFLKDKLQLSAKETLDRIRRCLETVGKLPVQFSLGEIAEADPEFLIEAAAVIAAGGAEVLNLADTNGGMYPQAAAELIGRVAAEVDRKSGTRIGVHFHNDLGLATANSLACLEAGARHVECTLGGLGERGGNAALEEIVFALEAFGQRLGLTHNIRLDQLWRTSTLLSRLTGISPHPNKAVLGKCALPESRPGEGGVDEKSPSGHLRRLMRGATIGRSEDSLFGDQEMSRAGFQQHLQTFRIDVEGVDLDKAYGLYQSQVRRKKTVTLSEVQSIVEQARLMETEAVYLLSSFSVMTGSHCLPVGSVELKAGESQLVQSATGTGPVDALCRAVDKAVGLNPRLILYSVDHLTEGKDARAEVTVSLSYMGRRFHGHSGSTDVVEASLRAYLEAVNNIEAHRRTYPEEQFYIDGEELWWE
jgi:2-isopropylmalate synthase